MLLFLAMAHAALPDDLVAAMSLRDCATVLASLPSPSTPDERLVVARCQVETGQPISVDLSRLSGVHRDYGRLLEARNAADREDWTMVTDALNGLALPGALANEVRLLRGRALIGQGASLDARPDLRELLETELGDEARYWLAIGGEQRGELPAAIATWERTWATSWRGPWAARSAEKLAAHGHPVPNPASERGRSLIRDRISLLKANHQYDEALSLLLLTEPSPLEEARARYRARDYKAATSLYAEILGPPPRAQGAAEDLFRYALANIRGTGDYDAADHIYTRLIAAHPGHARAVQAAYKRGYTAYDRGDCETAVPLFEGFRRAHAGAASGDEALWFIARCHVQRAEVDAARRAWSSLAAEYPRSTLVPGARYWLASTGPEDARDAAFERLINRYPTSGYAWFAAEHLGRRFAVRPSVVPPEWPEALTTRSDVQRGRALLAMGLDDWARNELQTVLPAVRGDKEAAIAAAWTLIEAGDYAGGRRLVQPWCRPAWEEGDPTVQQACYPRAEQAVVSPLTRRLGLPEHLPYGIMMAESAMKPHVTSIAGARGLMQLMPREAERVHATLYDDATYDPDRLYAGPYNASLGTTELGLRQASLGDLLAGTDLPAVIASYNGGEDAVRRWVGSYESPPAFDTFSEDIGYSETRRYVKRVLGHVMTYRWVYGDAPLLP